MWWKGEFMDNKYVFLYNGRSWYLMIDSLDALNEYIRIIWNIRKEDMLYDIKQLKEKKHPTSDIISACEVLAAAKGTDIWHEFMSLRERQHKEMTGHILAGDTLYVNSTGGYKISMDGITNRYESPVLRWPVFSEKDIRIKKWPGGVHFYAYIGCVQVKADDVQKWDTESDARAAAMRYVNKKKPDLK